MSVGPLPWSRLRAIAYKCNALANGRTLSPSEVVVIECLRRGLTDDHMRRLLDMSAGGLARVGSNLRDKLELGLDDSIRAAADRLGIPRLDLD